MDNKAKETFLQEFVDKVRLTGYKPFSLKAKESDTVRNYCFIKDEVGQAIFIYGEYGYGEESILTNLSMKYKLVAIYVDNIIYLYDPLFFGIWRNDDIHLPECVTIFNEKIIKGYNNIIKTFVFPNFIESLEDIELEENDIRECRQKARESVFASKYTETYHLPEFNEQTVINIISGLVDVVEIITKLLEEKKPFLTYDKAIVNKVKQFMKEPDIVEDWEKRLADGLNSINAKYVTVEFTVGEKTTVGKISPKAIIRKMIRFDDIDKWDFDTITAGSKVMKDLGLEGWQDRLYPSHITKVTYGKKVLFERKED